jgi:hypothetical protein
MASECKGFASGWETPPWRDAIGCGLGARGPVGWSGADTVVVELDGSWSFDPIPAHDLLAVVVAHVDDVWELLDPLDADLMAGWIVGTGIAAGREPLG